MDISFVIVNFQSEKFLQNCLLSLKNRLENISSEVIIVNNDKTVLENFTETAFTNIRIINRGVNDGFAKACNAGAKLASGNVLFFLNPDTEIKTIDFDKILNLLQDSATGIVAPRLISPDGNVQSWGCGYDITMFDIIRNNFGFAKSRKLWTGNVSMEADWVSGCAFAIRKSLFEELFGFDENFFMYFEDVDLCKRIGNLRKKITVLPEIQVLHFGGQSASSTKQQKKQYYLSQDYYFKKHRSVVELFFLKIFRNVALFFKK